MAVSKVCSVAGCGKSHEARGWCRLHYERWKKSGDPLGGGTSPGAPLKWLHEVALKHTGDECLRWPFSKITAGYGDVWINGKHVFVHRHICELVNGPPPTPEHEAAHSCGKGHEGCCAPEHLVWKTSKENHADKIAHGTSQRGERHGNHKLTEAQAREIKARYRAGQVTQQALADEFGVCRKTIGDIARADRWAWLD